VNSSVFSEYKKFLKSKEFDFKDAPLYEDYANNSNQWQEYKQTMLKFVWESNGLVSLGTLVDDLFQNDRHRLVYESANEKNINTLLANVFGKSDESLIVPCSNVDVVEIISSNNVVKISIDENVKIAEVRKLQGETMFISNDKKIYTTGKHLHQTIELVIITKPNTAKNKLAKIALVSDVDQHGTRTYAGWVIDFPGESFATRMNKKFMENENV
jgi:hypothetical protein